MRQILEVETENNELSGKIKSSGNSENNEKANAFAKKLDKSKANELELKIALKKTEETNFLTNIFLANLTHEIRTLLNSIIEYTTILGNESIVQNRPELFSFTNEMKENSSHLLGSMENINDLSRIEANDYEVNISDFDLSKSIDNCLIKSKKAAEAKEIQFLNSAQANLIAIGDKRAFEKSLHLILANAIKYTNQGNISIDTEKDEPQKIIILKVSDNGFGIDKSFLPHIFEVYRQESTGYNKLHKGIGLGLPLAQKLMNLSKGSIQIESEIGRGSTVYFKVPLGLSENISDISGSVPVIKSETQIKKKWSVFIVEDDKMNRLVFEKILEQNAILKMAVDGTDAFKQLEKAIDSEYHFDIILLDINLPPPWDGIQLLKLFREKWPKLNNIPIVAQTAYAMSGDKERFLEIGFDDYISKPIDKRELFTIIENNIRKFSAY
ncbi:MAG: hybrid sensor histidine kinase/response regulator [Bacteroidota bacterium]